MKFAATLPLRYAHDPHPVLDEYDTDGFILIHADSYDEACNKMFAHLGQAWAFVYAYETPEDQAKVDQYQPNGAFMEID